MNVLSLFAGIGGLDLGLERAGMTVVGQVEIDPFCRAVLEKHWPEVPRHDDVRTAVGWWLARARPAVDVVCGGFPCQPFSTAGRRLGLTDQRWGWPWFAAIVRALRPRFVVVENVAALLRDRDAFGWLLGDLAEIGYDAEWDCVPAAAVGAPHRRDRLFLVAYTDRDDIRKQPVGESGSSGSPVPGLNGAGGDVADTAGRDGQSAQPQGVAAAGWPAPEPGERRSGEGPGRHWWIAEPDVGRVAHGVPRRVDRLRALGNAVVPQVAEHVGRLVMGAAA